MASNYNNVVLASNPVLYYRLQDTVGTTHPVDSSNNSNTGTVTGTVTFGGSGPWNGDTSALFDGSSGYLESNSNVSSLTSVSIEAWCYMTVAPNTNPYIILGGTTNGNNYVGIDSTGHARFAAVIGSVQTIAQTTTLSLNTWHHLVGTWDGTTMSLYVDGILAASSTPVGSITLGAQQWLVGKYSGAAYYWPGSLAELAVYGTALTSNQVWTHYTTFTPSSNLSPGSQRPFTLQDVISSLNQDVENANSSSLNIDNTATQVLPINESPALYDSLNNGTVSVTATTASSQTIGSVTWGEATWTS